MGKVYKGRAKNVPHEIPNVKANAEIKEIKSLVAPSLALAGPKDISPAVQKPLVAANKNIFMMQTASLYQKSLRLYSTMKIEVTKNTNLTSTPI